MPTDTKLTHQQQLEQLEATAQGIAQIVGPLFDAAGAGFALIGFTFGEGGWSTWVSNAERADMVRALREMADHLEANTDIPPAFTGRDPEAG